MQPMRAALVALVLSAWNAAVAAPFAFIAQVETASVAVVDLATRSIVSTIPLDGVPFVVSTNPSGTRAYVGNLLTPRVHVIDTASRTLVNTLTGPSPAGAAAVSPDGTRLAVPYGGTIATPLSTLTLYDAPTLGRLQDVGVGPGPVAAIFNPAGTRVYTTNAVDGTLSVVDVSTMRLVSFVQLQTSPFMMAVHPTANRLYVTQTGTDAVPGFNVAVVDLATNTLVTQVRFAGTPAAIAMHPSGTRAFVSVPEEGHVAVLDTATNTITSTIQTGGQPLSVAVTPDGSQVVIVDGANNRLHVYDAGTLNLVYTMTVPGGPVALGGNFVVGSASANAPNLPGARSGLWWNPNESGWGIHFTHRGNTMFAAWYTYDAAGRPKWYVASSCAETGTGCSGILYEVTRASGFFGVPFNPSASVVSNAGTLSVTFSGNDAGTMAYTVGGQSRIVPIARQVFRASGTTPAVNYTDLWWNPSESGWGMAITQQFQTMFLAWFVYDAAGQPVWYVASDCAVNAAGNGCSGAVYRTTGPALGPTFDPSRVSVFSVGNATLTFTDGNNGMLSYTVDGVSGSKSITRQLF